MSTTCIVCRRDIAENEVVWGQDWYVFDGTDARTVCRYTCDDCAPAEVPC